MATDRPRRPATRRDFEIAIICALTLEADAVDALFDHHWDEDGPPYDKAPGHPNSYSTGTIGRHNVVLTYMPGMGKANAAAVASNCRSSFPNIKLALVVGVCGVVPFTTDGDEIVLDDVVVSDAIVQYDLGRRLPERFIRKDTCLDSFGRPNPEIRGILAKLRGLRSRKLLRAKIASHMDVSELSARYPGASSDRLFEATYRHVADGQLCDRCGCNGPLVPRGRLEQDNPQPAVHFGQIASGDTVMKPGEERDAIAHQESVVGFEMEGAGVWDTFPCVVIKGACDYADSHKTKSWQRYAAATAAACMKAFLDYWTPSLPPPTGISCHQHLRAARWPMVIAVIVPYPRNDSFVGRTDILQKLQQHPLKSQSQTRVSLFGLGGIGKTQIALEYAYGMHETNPDVSVFWIHSGNTERFRQSFTAIATECQIPGYDDPKVNVLSLVQNWLEDKHRGWWMMILDNADDLQLFFPPAQEEGSNIKHDPLSQYIPECAHGSVFVTTRNRKAGSRLAKGNPPIKVVPMNDDDSAQLLRTNIDQSFCPFDTEELSMLSSRLENLPLALAQGAAFIDQNTMAVSDYLRLLDESDKNFMDLLSEEFETVGRDSSTPRALAETWTLSFEQIQIQSQLAARLLSLMSFFDRQAIPVEFLKYNTGERIQEGIGEIQLQKALGILKGFSFITAGNGRSINLHRLVQLVTRKWLVKNKAMSYYEGQAISAVSEAYPYGGKFENWAICRQYLPHADAVLTFSGTGSPDERLNEAGLLQEAGVYLWHQGQLDNAEGYLLKSVEIRKDILRDGHGDTLCAMGNLASIYSKQKRLVEAEELQVQVLKIRKRLYGEESALTAHSISNLAGTYWNQGRFEEAEKMDLRVLHTRRRLFGERDRRTLHTVSNLASTYSRQGGINLIATYAESILELP